MTGGEALVSAESDGSITIAGSLQVDASATGETGTIVGDGTGGTAQVTAGLGEGSLDGAQQQGTVTAGEYTAARGPGGGRP